MTKYTIYHKPLEKPPGGTRPFGWAGRSFSAGPVILLVGLWAGCWPPPLPLDAGSDPLAASCCCCWTKIFGSTVFMQKFKFDEFCWSYFGLGWAAFCSGSPKIFECPPPGGFRTRLDDLSDAKPTLNSVLIFLCLWYKCVFLVWRFFPLQIR